MSSRTCLLTLLIGLTWIIAVQAEEEDIPIDKLPPKVTATVKKQFPDAEIVSASREKEDDQILIEVQIKQKGQTIEVSCTEDGKIVEVEKEIAAKDLPAKVSETINARYPKATFQKIEEITREGKVAFEVLITTAEKKKLEIKYDSEGMVLEMEDKTGKKDD